MMCRYGDSYVYPTWAEGLGLLMSLSSMVMVPGYAIYYVLTQPGSIMQVSHSGISWGQNFSKETKLFSKDPDAPLTLRLIHHPRPNV